MQNEMQNQKIQQIIENYEFGKSDYELYWELTFSSLPDIEEIVQHAWELQLPIPFLALTCRLCLEMSNQPKRLSESLVFLGAHSDYTDDANLKSVAQRLNLSLKSTHLEER